MDEGMTVDEGPERVGPQSTLVFNSLDGARGDSGDYTCTGAINTTVTATVYRVKIHSEWAQGESTL